MRKTYTVTVEGRILAKPPNPDSMTDLMKTSSECPEPICPFNPVGVLFVFMSKRHSHLPFPQGKTVSSQFLSWTTQTNRRECNDEWSRVQHTCKDKTFRIANAVSDPYVVSTDMYPHVRNPCSKYVGGRDVSIQSPCPSLPSVEPEKDQKSRVTGPVGGGEVA